MKGNLLSIGKGGSRIAAIALLLLAGALFVVVGRWQLARAEAQSVTDAKLQSAKAMPELDLGAGPVTEQDAFRPAFAEGTYDSAQQFYLDGRTQGNALGYHVITALRLAGSRRYVLVNRGWMPVERRYAPVPAGRVRVNGVLARAQLPGLIVGQPRGVTRPYLDPQAYALESGREVEPLMLVASGASTSLSAVNIERESKAAMHIGYAAQWFAFAALAFGASGVMVWRGTRDGG